MVAHDGLKDISKDKIHVDHEQTVLKFFKAQRIAYEEDPESLAHFKDNVNHLSSKKFRERKYCTLYK